MHHYKASIFRTQPAVKPTCALYFLRRELLRLVFGSLSLLLEELFLRSLQRNQLDRQLIQRAGEPERHLVVVVVYTSAGIPRGLCLVIACCKSR